MIETYYVYDVFADLKEPGDSVSIEADCEDVYAVAATNGKESAVLLTLYNDERESDEKDICIEVQRPHSGECVRAVYYLLDEDNDMALVCESVKNGETKKNCA